MTGSKEGLNIKDYFKTHKLKPCKFCKLTKKKTGFVCAHSETIKSNKGYPLLIEPEMMCDENCGLRTAPSEKIKQKTEEIQKIYEKVTLEQLRNKLRYWLAIKDDQWIEIILSSAIDRKILGEPIWVLIIGVPSSTKTEIVRCLTDGKYFYHLSTLSTNSLISGYVKPDGEKVDDLALQLDGKTLILKDFTSILSMSKDKRDEICGQLRELYDGELNKKLGNLDDKISIKSSMGLIACVTPIVDRYYSVMGQLGERFLKLRSDPNEDDMLDKAMENAGREQQMREELENAVMGFITNLEIKNNIEFSKEDLQFLKDSSKLLARLRAPAYVRLENEEDVMDIPPAPEKPVRIFKQFKKLAIALCNIYGIEKCDQRVLECIKRVTLDSAPQDRQRVYSYIIENNNCSEKDMREALKIPRTSLQRILMVLHRLDLLDSSGFEEFKTWKTTHTLYLNGGAGAPSISQRVYLPDSVEVEMIMDLPEHTDIDMKEYPAVKTGDKVSVSAVVADAWKSKGWAV